MWAGAWISAAGLAYVWQCGMIPNELEHWLEVSVSNTNRVWEASWKHVLSLED